MRAFFTAGKNLITFKNDPSEPDLPIRIWEDFLNDTAAINPSAYLVWDDRKQTALLDCSALRGTSDWWNAKYRSSEIAREYRDRMAEFWTHSY